MLTDAQPDVRRTAVRLLILDEDERLLLLHYLTPDTGEDFWCTPGGALHAGESVDDAARREALEEVGLELAAPLPPATWQRAHRFVIGDGRLFEQDETYHLVRVRHFDAHAVGLSEFERSAVVESRWWTLDELARTAEMLSPLELPELLRHAVDDPAC